MPIFEYACNQCHHRFEVLVRSSQSVNCPKCQSENLRRLLSVFNSTTASATPQSFCPPQGCGGCCGGDPSACMMN